MVLEWHWCRPLAFEIKSPLNLCADLLQFSLDLVQISIAFTTI